MAHGLPKEQLAQVVVQAVVMAVLLAQAAIHVILALRVTTRTLEIHAQNVSQALMPLLETLVVLLAVLLNGQLMPLVAAQIVSPAATRALTVPLVILVRMVITRTQEILVLNAPQTLMLLLEPLPVPPAAQVNGQQLDPAPAQIVLLAATHALMDPLVILAQMVIIKIQTILAHNVLQELTLLLEPLPVPLVAQLNGPLLDLAAALIVLLAAPHVLIVPLVLVVLEAMPRTQEILVLNVLRVIMLLLDLPVVLPVAQLNGLQLDLAAAQTVSLVALHALMAPLVLLAQTVITRIQEILAPNALQEPILLPEPLSVPLVAQANGPQMEQAAVEAVLVVVAHVLMVQPVILALVVITKTQEILVPNVLRVPMLLLALLVALLAAQPNGQQLELVAALTVSLVVSHALAAQLVLLVLVVIIKTQEILVPNVLRVLMLLLELLVALHAVQVNGHQLDQAAAQIVSLAVAHAQLVAPVLHALLVIIKTQQILAHNVIQEPILLLEPPAVLLVTQINGQQTEPAVARAVLVAVAHALMEPLVTLALLVITRILAIHAQNVPQTLMLLLEPPVVLHVVLVNGQQLELAAAQAVSLVALHVPMAPLVSLVPVDIQRTRKVFALLLVRVAQLIPVILLPVNNFFQSKFLIFFSLF